MLIPRKIDRLAALDSPCRDSADCSPSTYCERTANMGPGDLCCPRSRQDYPMRRGRSDFFAINIPTFLYASREDTSCPWRTATRRRRCSLDDYLDGFVLGASVTLRCDHSASKNKLTIGWPDPMDPIRSAGSRPREKCR